VVGAAEAAAKA